MKRIFLTFLPILFSLNALAVFQPMAVVPGTVVFSNGGGDGSGRGGRAPAYCVDFFAHVPGTNNHFSSAVSRGGSHGQQVRINFNTSPAQTLSFSQALQYINVTGDETNRGVMFTERSGASISSIEILEPFVAKGSDYQGFADSELRASLSEVSSQRRHDANLQTRIWRRQLTSFLNATRTASSTLNAQYNEIFSALKNLKPSSGGFGFQVYPKISFDSATAEGFKVFVNPKVKEARTHMDYINLADGGSASIFKNTVGEIILIDAGKSKRDAEKIMETLRRDYSTDKVKLNVMLTHPDADHIGGIRHMLDQNFKIEEIIIPPGIDHAAAEKKLDKLDSMLIPYGFARTEVDGLIRFVKGEAAKTKTTLSKTTKMNIHSMKIDQSVSVTGFQFLQPKTVNDHSLMSRVEFNGISQLNMGDVGKVPLQALIDMDTRKTELLSELGRIDRSLMDSIGISGNITTKADLNAILTRWVIDRSEGETDRETIRSSFQSALSAVSNQLIRRTKIVKELDQLKDFTLRSTVLQWPHHHSACGLDENPVQKVYDDFLNRVWPQTIILTNPPGNANQHRKNVLKYLDGYKKRHNGTVKLIFLEDEGTNSIRIISFHDEGSVRSDSPKGDD